MQISNATTTSLFSASVDRSASASASAHDTEGSSFSLGSDFAVLGSSASSFSSYVKEAKAMPEVRSEVVDAYKSRIQSGRYPSQEIVDGLLRLVGGAISEQLKVVVMKPTGSNGTQSAK